MLHARVEEAGGALVVTLLAPHLDAEVAPELRRVLVTQAGMRSRVVLSLANVGRVDCSVLAALVAAVQHMPPGGELRIVGATGPVRALLAATHLDQLFPLFDDPGAALAT